jgi:cysteine synthase
MPESMSIERRIMTAYGAKLELTPRTWDEGALQKLTRLQQQLKVWIPSTENPQMSRFIKPRTKLMI